MGEDEFICNKTVTLSVKFMEMSIAELKLKAIEALALLKDEESIKEIYMHLEKIQSSQKSTKLSNKFESISQRYDKTLEKLAQ